MDLSFRSVVDVDKDEKENTAMATAAKTTTASPKVMAKRLDKTEKAIRGWARDNLARFDKVAHPEYQAHEYTAAEQRTIEAGFKARGERSKAQKSTVAKPKVKGKLTTKSTPKPRTVKLTKTVAEPTV